MTETFASLHQYGDIALFILRAAIAMVFIVHGLWKVQHGKTVASSVGKPRTAWFFTTLGIAESLGAIALLAGFLTQIAAAGLACIMLGAIYMKACKWKVPFTAHDKTGWELDFMILASCVFVFVMGAGKIALDRTIFGLF